MVKLSSTRSRDPFVAKRRSRLAIFMQLATPIPASSRLEARRGEALCRGEVPTVWGKSGDACERLAECASATAAAHPNSASCLPSIADAGLVADVPTGSGKDHQTRNTPPE